ncbi:putative 6-oxopurine nucleoside phosphorylase [Compostibacillus humi]|uniref:Purine nucleoside phosphorylase n=1 Tax=Compostibacillus humi TaxID=1245525 RepID=A0A8J2TQW2_9BACI|nr:MTAP family purine nucleoside phosphorylase [Compostibacillus humi]GFZ82071.1 putative 6-oxopurine nucleoside phosphorylase [Compostibacillus humi]
MKIGLIGGTGFYDLFESLEEQHVSTDYGNIILYITEHSGKEVIFLPRHGMTHGVLAPYVNYKGNMQALKQMGVNKIIALSAVGSINPNISVGSLTLLDQFVDFTKRRDFTYGKFSADMSEPFCSDLKSFIKMAAKSNNQKLYEDAKLICVDGPIYETRSELQLFSSWGMDVVGMTNSTEAILARELGMCYAVVTLSTDIATGFSDIPPDLETHKIVAQENIDKAAKLIFKAVSIISDLKTCSCADSYEEYQKNILTSKEKV